MEEPEATTAEPPETTGSRVDDYVDIFVSPAQVFRRRTAGDWVQPFIVLVVLSIIVYVVSLPAQSAVVRAMMAQQGQNAQVIAAAQRYAGITRIVTAIVMPVILLVACAFTAALLWLAGRVVDIAVGFKEAFLIAIFARFVMLPAGLLKAGSLILADRSGSLHPIQDQSFGLLRFMHPATLPAALVPLLGQLDIFTIWQAAIWAVALAAMKDAPRGKAIAAAAMAWVVAAAPSVIMAAIRPQTMMMG